MLILFIGALLLGLAAWPRPHPEPAPLPPVVDPRMAVHLEGREARELAMDLQFPGFPRIHIELGMGLYERGRLVNILPMPTRVVR